MYSTARICNHKASLHRIIAVTHESFALLFFPVHSFVGSFDLHERKKTGYTQRTHNKSLLLCSSIKKNDEYSIFLFNEIYNSTESITLSI